MSHMCCVANAPGKKSLQASAAPSASSRAGGRPPPAPLSWGKPHRSQLCCGICLTTRKQAGQLCIHSKSHPESNALPAHQQHVTIGVTGDACRLDPATCTEGVLRAMQCMHGLAQMLLHPGDANTGLGCLYAALAPALYSPNVCCNCKWVPTQTRAVGHWGVLRVLQLDVQAILQGTGSATAVLNHQR